MKNTFLKIHSKNISSPTISDLNAGIDRELIKEPLNRHRRKMKAKKEKSTN